ncbi:hypothetical protein V6N13_144455 [Hibiscus sabdariffa]|uniref:RNase H type-1 domain-containing protein n=1 Tax=Hibiscus sabdariffa TaxID=183260 RepID=A0ABR2FKF9_9ROSI
MPVALMPDRLLHSNQPVSPILLPVPRDQVRWSLPPADWCKLNVDRARDHSLGFASCGGLIRDHNGQWLRGFARSLGVCSPIEVELWAVHEGLVQACVLGLKRIVLEVDGTLVVHLFSLLPRIVPSMTMVQHITSLLNRDWSVKIVHSFRKANAVADRLAKSVNLSSLDFRIFVDPTPFIFYLL